MPYFDSVDVGDHAPGASFSRIEYKDVLPGKKRQHLLKLEAHRFQLSANVLDTHFVKRLNRNVRIFLSKFHKRDTAVRLQSPSDLPHHGDRIRELMVNVD